MPNCLHGPDGFAVQLLVAEHWEWRGDKKGGRVGVGELSQQHKAPFSLQEAMECPTMAHAKLSLMKMIC